MIQIIILALTILLSCISNQETKKQIIKNDTTAIAKSKISSADSPNADTEIIETFVDSLTIGVKGRCKVELIKHRVYDDHFIIMKFYIKGISPNNELETWMNTNTYCYETDAMMGFEPNILDFNNDNFNDITFLSGTSARSANDVRRLFIYDDQRQKLISIINSEHYSNMRYNKELNCIDAFLVYGGCSTIFLNIEGDCLKKFASVELFDGLTVTIYDKKGKETVIKKDKTNKATNKRYKNYNPLKEYDNY